MADASSGRRISHPYGWLLLGLLLLFFFRVAAQLIQAYSPVTSLPPFETWQSGALPYPLLVSLQLIILVACGRVVWSFLSGTVVPSGKKGPAAPGAGVGLLRRDGDSAVDWAHRRTKSFLVRRHCTDVISSGAG